jgi:AhpC/TSA family
MSASGSSDNCHHGLAVSHASGTPGIFLIGCRPSPGYHSFSARTVPLGGTMKHLLVCAMLLAIIPTLTSSPAQPQKKDEVARLSLKIGDTAPDFTLLSDEWKTVKLSDFHGKKNVFLAVYVLAFTGG